MVASSPASTLNQTRHKSGIPTRCRLNTSGFSCRSLANRPVEIALERAAEIRYENILVENYQRRHLHDVAAIRHAEELRRDQAGPCRWRVGRHGGDCRQDLVAENLAHAGGGAVVGCRRAQQDGEAAARRIAPPQVQIMLGQATAAVMARHCRQIWQVEVERCRGGKQSLLAAEVAHDHGGIDVRVGRHGPDRGALVALGGKKPARGLEDPSPGLGRAAMSVALFWHVDFQCRRLLTLRRTRLYVNKRWPTTVGMRDGPTGLSSRRPHRLVRSEEHTSELQSLRHLVCRLLLEKKKKKKKH